MARQHSLTASAPDPADLQPQRSFAFLAIAIFAVYMGFAAGLWIWLGIFVTPDLWIIALFIGAIVLGRSVAFLRDWIPFVFLIFGYEMLRGFAGGIVLDGGFSREQHGRIQVESLLAADRALFGGHVPTLWLQEQLFDPGIAHWYDVLALLVYLLHFVFPLVFAFLLWIQRKERFWQFSLALLAMTYSAFIFFILVPAAPPWLADDWGYIQGMQNPSHQAFLRILPHRLDSVDTFRLWTHASPNPVAAMPSLHAAFPWLVLLFAVRFFGRRGLIFLAYNAALWFSVVYLGHHWVIDVIAGIIWATIWFVVIVLAWPWMNRSLTAPRAIRIRSAITARASSPRTWLRERRS